MVLRVGIIWNQFTAQNAQKSFMHHVHRKQSTATEQQYQQQEWHFQINDMTDAIIWLICKFVHMTMMNGMRRQMRQLSYTAQNNWMRFIEIPMHMKSSYRISILDRWHGLCDRLWPGIACARTDWMCAKLLLTNRLSQSPRKQYSVRCFCRIGFAADQRRCL